MLKASTFWIFLLIGMFGISEGKACSHSSFSLTSLQQTGPSQWTFGLQICIGGGRTQSGSLAGAFDNTRDFGIGYHVPGSGPVQLTFAPDSLGSDTLGTVKHGVAVGAGFLNSDEFIFFSDPLNDFFTCNYNYIPCGTPHLDCFDLSLVADVYPDSIEVMGVEGDGNPINGCYKARKMVLIFANRLPVIWGEGGISLLPKGIQLAWSTLIESGNGKFEIMRATPSQDFEKIGEVQSHGNSFESQNYLFYDDKPLPGTNMYQIRQEDFDGSSSYSPIYSSIWKESDALLLEGLSYAPLSESLNLQLYCSGITAINLRVYSSMGEAMVRAKLITEPGQQEHRLEGIRLNPGIYIIEVKGYGSALRKKIRVY